MIARKCVEAISFQLEAYATPGFGTRRRRAYVLRTPTYVRRSTIPTLSHI